MVAGRHSHTVQKKRNVTEVQWNYGTVARWNSVMISRRHSHKHRHRAKEVQCNSGRHYGRVAQRNVGTEEEWTHSCTVEQWRDQNSGIKTVKQSKTLAQRHSAKIEQHSTGTQTESGKVEQRNSGTDAK
ncbi:hypothetical protein ACROYT_G029351 [Oculina patagonica]